MTIVVAEINTVRSKRLFHYKILHLHLAVFFCRLCFLMELYACCACRGDSCVEAAKDGKGEGRISHHVTARDQHTAEGTTSQHCHCQGL